MAGSKAIAVQKPWTAIFLHLTAIADGYTFKNSEIIYVWADKTVSSDNYINAWKLTATGTNGGFNGDSKAWPYDGSKLNFHALHGNFTESDLNNNWSDLTSLKHTVLDNQSSDENRRQSDLLFAEKAEATHGNNVELSFSHLLAKITVKLDLKNSTGITTNDFENATVSIMGIKPEATFDSSAETASTSGGEAIEINAGTIAKPSNLLSEAYDAGCAIVPLQTIPAEQQLIKITLNDRTFIYKASEVTTFQKGMEYTYTLTILGEKITGSLSVSPFLSEEDEQISFKEYFPYLADLKNRNYLGSEAEPHDLSLDYNGLMNTANCYVVTHPGYYKFPLVYGNAIKNGATNAIAYGVGTGSTTFVNHLDQQITDPYIYNNTNCTVGSAVLLWQDAENLISNISLCDDKKYIKFEITKDNIEQGNAVIAVKDGSGTIMWSWHIWVTNKNVYDTYTYGDYNFMPIALGQRETAQGTTCTFYQWGRKDPFKGATGSGQETDNMETLPSYNSSILNPDKFIKGTENPYCYNWFNGNLKDLWNVGNTAISNSTSTSQKTIYDPSPVGFKVPPPAAFPYIGLKTDYWQSTSGQEGISVPDSDDFWRAFGLLFWESGSSASVGSIGYYWSCGPNEYGSDRNGWYLFFHSGNVDPKNNAHRSYGFPVRPVSE